MTEEREESHIQWHPAFYAATKLELRDNINELEFYPEYNLSKKPLQADLLIIEKNGKTRMKNAIGHIFRKHNIVEYKSPGDGMTVDDFYKCVAYACLYKSTGENVNEIAGDELSITMIRESYPKSMMRELKRLGIGFVKYEAGIYHSRNIFIPAQLIVTQELKPDEHRSLRILSRNADENDVKGFIKETLGYVTQGEKADVQAVLKASGTAIYDRQLRNYIFESVRCTNLTIHHRHAFATLHHVTVRRQPRYGCQTPTAVKYLLANLLNLHNCISSKLRFAITYIEYFYIW